MSVMVIQEPVSATTPDHSTLLEEAFLALETPEGFRAELIEGEIIVTPPPDGQHEDAIDILNDQFRSQSATRMQLVGNKGIRLPAGKGTPRRHVIPNLTVAPRKLRLFFDAPPWMAPEGVLLVAEVTSNKPARDQTEKRRGYAGAGIPYYLLVNRNDEQVTLFSGPAQGDYQESHSVPYGKALFLPGPFSFELDTSELTAPLA